MLIQISEGWYLQAGFLRYFSLDFSTNQGKKNKSQWQTFFGHSEQHIWKNDY
jgi:hypothetical protein